MKQQSYRQIYHVKTKSGYEVSPEQKIVKLNPEDAEKKNEQWKENGYRLVPQNKYEKFLQNSRLLN
jgi:hypothetical protein